MSESANFVEMQIPHQKFYNGIQFPYALSPNPETPLSLSHLTQAIKSQKPFLEALLLKSGALLFRGIPVSTASTFNDVVEAFGFDELPYVGGGAPRTKVVGRVTTANESPPDQNIPFHHEMVQLPEFPSKLFFFCEVEPGSGGETPIVLSHIVYERMKERHPEFVGRLEEHGLVYTRVLLEDDDPLSPIGRGWKSTLSTEDKSVAGQRAAKLGMKLEWLKDGAVKTIWGPMPAIKYDKARQRNVWFNQMAFAYTVYDAGNDPGKAVTFGDGKPIPAYIINDCVNILEEESVAFPWQRGDILLLDNLAVLHSRRSSKTPRRILASLCK
ncbi:clavaminate synthase-like protein At3g21360 [Carya illinoinensis]|uniref:clavaminate synthase-like protein At3g21360 n=1 Tax=Carya illinoinensis TaxID=32201 RepID=UPI001C7223E6|nr:clavaminate synthase-like protein At3g21360 [Carya illinoinensis]